MCARAIERRSSRRIPVSSDTEDSPLRRQFIALKEQKLPYVEIVPMYGGADGTLV